MFHAPLAVLLIPSFAASVTGEAIAPTVLVTAPLVTLKVVPSNFHACPMSPQYTMPAMKLIPIATSGVS